MRNGMNFGQFYHTRQWMQCDLGKVLVALGNSVYS